MKIKPTIRQSLFFSLLIGGTSLLVMPAHSEILPDIEAHQFKSMPLEKSSSGRVYKFHVDPMQVPRVGSIVLIQENDHPIMAFRVLKNDGILNEYIGKRVRRYDATGELQLNQNYQTVEKVADLVAPPPPEPGTYDPNAKPLLDPSSNNKVASGGDAAAGALPPLPADTSAMASSAQATNKAPINLNKYDDDLDTGTSPTNLKDETMAGDAGGDLQPSDVGQGLEVRERTVLNPFNNMVGVQVSDLRNMTNFKLNAGGGGGVSFYYANVAKRSVFTKNESPQDSLYLQYGLSYYSLVNVSGTNDSYNLLPLSFELREDIHFSEMFTVFGYIGPQYNLIMASTNSNASAVSSLGGFQLNVGVGILYTIGPQWYLRGDLGLDRIGIGLAVKW